MFVSEFYFWIAFAVNFEFSLLKILLLLAAILKKNTKKPFLAFFGCSGLMVALPKPCLVGSSLVYSGSKLDFELKVRSAVGGLCWGEAELKVSTFSHGLRLQRWKKRHR